METHALYSIWGYFFLYSFLGWCLEVVFCSVNTGTFVNRGFLNGPVCPIYGFGAVFVILLLTPLVNNIILLFFASVIITSLLELLTGFILKVLFKTSWWDYSKEPYNIGGFICLKFSLGWGIACLFLMKVLHPILSEILSLIPIPVGVVMLITLSLVMLLDCVVTTFAIRKLNHDLGEITLITNSLHKSSTTLAKNLGNAAISLADKLEALDLEYKKEQLTKQATDSREIIAKTIEENKVQIESKFNKQKEKIAPHHERSVKFSHLIQLLENKHPVRERLIRAFPNMKNQKYNEALKELKIRHSLNKTDNSDGTENKLQK